MGRGRVGAVQSSPSGEAVRGAVLLGAGAVGLLLLRRDQKPETPPAAPSPRADRPGKPEPRPLFVPRTSDGQWRPAYLTEYHPDAPPSKRKLEGGPLDRKKHPVITVEQHRADRERYPFVTVAGDLVIAGQTVPYGVRLYLEQYPELIFRLFDTGGHFHGEEKVIRVEGHEPFDVATRYPQPSAPRLGISGTRTRHRIDYDDVINYPSWLQQSCRSLERPSDEVRERSDDEKRPADLEGNLRARARPRAQAEAREPQKSVEPNGKGRKKRGQAVPIGQ